MLAAAADFLPDGLVIVEGETVLIDVIDLRARADFHLAVGRRQFADDVFQQGRFAEAVAADNAEALASPEVKIHVIKELPPAEFHADVGQRDDAIGELRRGRDDHLDVDLLFRRTLGRFFEIALDTVHRFGAPRAGSAPHPFQFVLEKHLPLVLDAGLGGFALRLGDQIVVVTALVIDEAAARQLDDARGDAVEKVAVVRHEQARAGVAREKVFQPLDALGVEVIGRFVEDEKIRTREESSAERHTALFTAAEGADEAVERRGVQVGGEAPDAVIQRPPIVMIDLVEQRGRARAFGGRGLVLGEQFEHALGAAADVHFGGGIVIEGEDLKAGSR